MACKTTYEYGLLVEEKSLVTTIRRDYLSLYMDREAVSNVTYENIDRVEKMISSVPREQRPKMLIRDAKLLKLIDNDYITSEKFSGGTSAIASNLSGWSKDMFLSLNEFDEDVFDLSRAYEFEGRLQNLYPRNKHVKDKIRQQLQYLRNHGLLEFLGAGRYKKLWAQQD